MLLTIFAAEVSTCWTLSCVTLFPEKSLISPATVWTRPVTFSISPVMLVMDDSASFRLSWFLSDNILKFMLPTVLEVIIKRTMSATSANICNPAVMSRTFTFALSRPNQVLWHSFPPVAPECPPLLTHTFSFASILSREAPSMFSACSSRWTICVAVVVAVVSACDSGRPSSSSRGWIAASFAIVVRFRARIVSRMKVGGTNGTRLLVMSPISAATNFEGYWGRAEYARK